MARGVAATWILTGVLSAVIAEDEMDIDGAEGKGKERATEVNEGFRGVLIVQDADLQGTLHSSHTFRFSSQAFVSADPHVFNSNLDKLSLFVSTPSSHIYSLSPVPLPTLEMLTGYALPSLFSSSSETATSKWKKIPEGGYGGISHPDGNREPLLDSDLPPPLASTSTSKSTTVKQDIKPAPTIAAEKKSKPTPAPIASKSTAKGKGTAAKEVSKPPAKVFRPIGSLGGLFAKQTEAAVVKKKKHDSPAPDSPVAKKKPKNKVVVEDKKKVVKKAGRANGAFADEEVETDSDGEDPWDEDAEAEMQALEDAENAKEAARKKEAAKKKKEALEEKKKIAAERMKSSSSGKPSSSVVDKAKGLQDMMDLDDEDVKPVKEEIEGEDRYASLSDIGHIHILGFVAI